MLKKVVRFFDKLEDRVRAALSHQPIIYAFVGGVGIVLFWKGVFETADFFPWLYGPASLLIGTLILLVSGLLVSFFIGDNIIISGFKHEKKLAEKTEAEIKAGEVNIREVLLRLEAIEHHLERLSAPRPRAAKKNPTKETVFVGEGL